MANFFLPGGRELREGPLIFWNGLATAFSFPTFPPLIVAC